MTKRRLLISLLVFLLYVAIATAGAWFLAPQGLFSWVLFVLIAVGLTVLIVYLLIARLQSQSRPAAAASDHKREDAAASRASSPSDDSETAALTALITEANLRLARSPKLASRRVKASVTRLPMFLLGGMEGAGKTSVFLKSGLEPELLAGQVFRDSTVLPTALVNLWFAEDCLFAELSGSLFSGDPERWRRVLGHLQGRSTGGFIKRLFGGKTEAPLRGFVLFCDIAPFLGPPDPTRLGSLSRRMQERLRQVGESFGTNFPVYVIFTRSESVPRFAEFFSRLVENEDQQILGCTLPGLAPGARPAGEVYAEAETARVATAFDALYRSLAGKRLLVMPRETDAAVRPVMYEYPREMKRIRDSLVQFLVDVFRPNPLQPGPILRGFYFTGVRQVTVSAIGPSVTESAPHPVSGEATSLFNLADYQKRMGLATQAPVSSSEKSIQRWSFVAELFHRVILRDPIGRAVAFAHSRQAMYKRIAFGIAAAFCLILCLLWLRSWWNNASLLGDIEAATHLSEKVRPNTAARTTGRALPSLEALTGLEALRVQLKTLLDYDRNGAPWRMRWGLYAGDRVLPSTYGLYFQEFKALFFEDIKNSLSDSLKHLPQVSDDQNHPYDVTYDQVKAYRMITQRKCTPDPDFLEPVLENTRFPEHNLDDERRTLAARQIKFYAQELQQQNPYPKNNDEDDSVTRAGRSYLNSFGSPAQRLYHSLLAEANKSPRSPARLASLAPNYAQVLKAPPEVAAAFTRDGWNFFNDSINDSSKLQLGDTCVLGDSASVKQLLQSGQVTNELWTLYNRDFINRWKDFAANTSVLGFNNASDAAGKLEILADNRSPLLAAVALIAQNTAVPGAAPAGASAADKAAGLIKKFGPSNAKSLARKADTVKQALGGSAEAPPDIASVFQPATSVVSVGSDKLKGDLNKDYMEALTNLQYDFQQLKDSQDQTVNQKAADDVRTGLIKAKSIEDNFELNTEGVDHSLSALLEAPFKQAQGFIETDPGKAASSKANGALQQFCRDRSGLDRVFPFDPSSDKDATVKQITDVFAPGSGSLAALQQKLQMLVVKQNKLWVASPDAKNAKPTAAFLSYLNRMQQIQDALFADGSSQLKMTYALKPILEKNVDAISLVIDGHSFVATKDNAQALQLSWPGGSGGVTANVKVGGNRPFGYYEGSWAVFRWMYDSDSRAIGAKIVRWSKTKQAHGQPQPIGDDAQGNPIVPSLEISEFPGGADVFNKDFFTLKCPGKAAE